jgi:flagellar protein FlaJ
LISIKHLARLGGKASSSEDAALQPSEGFGPKSLFAREPEDFDLVSQLTHMSAVATSGIARDKLFEGTAELEYSTSKYFRRVHRVAQRLNYDYSKACEVVAEQVQLESVQNLLLHFATALSAGEAEIDFLERETEVQLELYGKKYERDVESLRKWTDAYIALMVSTTLIVVISMVSMMIYPLGTMALVGLAFIVMMVTAAGAWIIFAVAPHEVKTHRLKRKSYEQQQMERLGVIVVTLCGPAIVGGWILFELGVGLILAALLITPLGVLAWRDDHKIDQRDIAVPPFLRGLGSVMGAVGTTVPEGLARLNRRSLGGLEPHVRRLYVRLSNDLESSMVWARLCGETGSELVTRSIRIFAEGIRLGGDPAAVGNLAAAYVMKITLLRSSRALVSSTFMFVVMPMHAALLAIMLFVTEVVRVFGGQIADIQEQSIDSTIIQEAGVSQAISFASPDMGFISVFVGLVIIMLTFANAFAPYAAAGGHRFKLFVFLACTLAISGIAMLIIPHIVQGLFQSVSETPLTGTETSVQ